MPITVRKLTDHRRGGRHLVRQLPGGAVTLGRGGLGENRDEGRRERPLGEKIAQQVRDAERHLEGVHDLATAEDRAEHLIAHEAQQTAAEHRQGDDARGPGVQLFMAGGRRGGAGPRGGEIGLWHRAPTVPYRPDEPCALHRRGLGHLPAATLALPGRSRCRDARRTGHGRAARAGGRALRRRYPDLLPRRRAVRARRTSHTMATLSIPPTMARGHPASRCNPSRHPAGRGARSRHRAARGGHRRDRGAAQFALAPGERRRGSRKGSGTAASAARAPCCAPPMSMRCTPRAGA